MLIAMPFKVTAGFNQLFNEISSFHATSIKTSLTC
jgi:hypothetical protein